ncbi:ankyrin repeat domain-containing protein [Pseudorhodobacter sp. E13]|uniref:ankyrin repeat domain-containing protein n=1 Tax=Pseudorhodobacter sp. E13 TaxID=2487931 RepID=UPI000F8EEC80|nr:ankyrin repeat domain-containing protein [Pseudorhodobacter sp. E13]
MKHVDFSTVDRLLEWDDKLRDGDLSMDQWAIETLLSDCRVKGVPIVFYAPGSDAAVTLSLAAGVDFTPQNPEGETVLFDGAHLEITAYGRVAESFAKRGKIDLAETEGLTALSAQVKFGNLDRVKLLLRHGADVGRFATIARYGNARLTIPQQAINVMTTAGPAEKETLSITLLDLLKAHGLRLDAAEKSDLLQRARTGPRLHEWIDRNL